MYFHETSTFYSKFNAHTFVIVLKSCVSYPSKGLPGINMSKCVHKVKLHVKSLIVDYKSVHRGDQIGHLILSPVSDSKTDGPGFVIV